MIDKIKSLINPLVPIGLAVKGLEKINPKMKAFFGGATAAGYSANEAMDFLRSEFGSKQNQFGNRPDEEAAMNRSEHERAPERLAKGAAIGAAGILGGIGGAALGGLAAGSDEQQPTQQQSTNPFQEFISQNPELGGFLQKEISSGISPSDAAMKAKGIKKFRESIASIEDEVGQPFESLLGQLFQGSQAKPQSQSSPQQAKGSSPAMTNFMQALQEFKRLSGL